MTQQIDYSVNDGLDELEWMGPGLYMVYAQEQYNGEYGSVAYLWETLEEYNNSDHNEHYPGTPALFYSVEDWKKLMTE